MDKTERWAARFEQASLAGKAALLGGTAVRLTANLIDKTLDRAAGTVAEAECSRLVAAIDRSRPRTAGHASSASRSTAQFRALISSSISGPRSSFSNGPPEKKRTLWRGATLPAAP